MCTGTERERARGRGGSVISGRVGDKEENKKDRREKRKTSNYERKISGQLDEEEKEEESIELMIKAKKNSERGERVARHRAKCENKKERREKRG